MIKKRPEQSKEQINAKSKELKRARKHKGLPSGSRFKDKDSTKGKPEKEIKDSRIGSKKPISLDPNFKKTKESEKLVVEKVVEVNYHHLSPEKELETLENDPYLEKLLDLIDDGQSLTSAQQEDLDKMLDRIEELMTQLGYSDDDEDETELTQKEDIVSLLKNN